jgi:hypothetical protein
VIVIRFNQISGKNSLISAKCLVRCHLHFTETDGQTEIVNKCIEYLRHFVFENQDDWDKLLFCRICI